MRLATAYKLGQYNFCIPTESVRTHNIEIVEYPTLGTTFVHENMETISVRAFSVTERTQSTLDVNFLKLMVEVPQSYTLTTDRGNYTVAIEQMTIEQRYSFYEITLRLIEVSEVKPLRIVVETPNTDLTDNVIALALEPTTVGRCGTLTLTVENKDSDQSFAAAEADTITVYVGENMELWNFGDYYVDKIYNNMGVEGWFSRFEARTLSAQKLADTEYASDETWDTSTTIYDLITANDSSAILYNTSLSDTGVSTLLDSRYLSTQRIVKAGTTKMQALSDLISYIYTDLSEEWVAYTSDSGDILYVQPAFTGGTVQHEFIWSSNIFDATVSQARGSRNFIIGYGSDLADTQATTTFTDKKTDANYDYKHNCACLPVYDTVYVVVSDTGNSQGIISSYDDTNGYVEHYYDLTNSTYNCCFAYSTTNLLIGTDTKILEYTISAEEGIEIIKDDCYKNYFCSIITVSDVPYVVFDNGSYELIEAKRNAASDWSLEQISYSGSAYFNPALFTDGSVIWIVAGFSSEWLYLGEKQSINSPIIWTNLETTYSAEKDIVVGTTA